MRDRHLISTPPQGRSGRGCSLPTHHTARGHKHAPERNKCMSRPEQGPSQTGRQGREPQPAAYHAGCAGRPCACTTATLASNQASADNFSLLPLWDTEEWETWGGAGAVPSWLTHTWRLGHGAGRPAKATDWAGGQLQALGLPHGPGQALWLLALQPLLSLQVSGDRRSTPSVATRRPGPRQRHVGFPPALPLLQGTENSPPWHHPEPRHSFLPIGAKADARLAIAWP